MPARSCSGSPRPYKGSLPRAAGWIALTVSLLMAAAARGLADRHGGMVRHAHCERRELRFTADLLPRVAAGLGLGLPVCALMGHFLVSVMRN